MKHSFRSIVNLVFVLTLILSAHEIYADTVGTYGDVTIVTGPDNQPAWQLTSSVAGQGYAGIYLALSTPITVAQLNDLSANYVMTTGTFGGGAPRFSIIDSTNNNANEAYVYWGTPLGGGTFIDPNLGNTTYANTGNLADAGSPDVRVYSNGFGGYGNGNTGQTWAQFQSDPFAAGTTISYITIDLDASFALDQVMDIQSFTIAGVTYTPSVVPEPSTYALLLLAGVGLSCCRLYRKRAGRC